MLLTKLVACMLVRVPYSRLTLNFLISSMHESDLGPFFQAAQIPRGLKIDEAITVSTDHLHISIRLNS